MTAPEARDIANAYLTSMTQNSGIEIEILEKLLTSVAAAEELRRCPTSLLYGQQLCSFSSVSV